MIEKFIDGFSTGFLTSADRKVDNYDAILVIIDFFIKMIDYEPVKVTINATNLVEVITNIMIQYYSRLESIVID